MLNAYMNEQDVPSAKEAEAFVTVGEQRYNLLNAKNLRARQTSAPRRSRCWERSFPAGSRPEWSCRQK